MYNIILFSIIFILYLFIFYTVKYTQKNSLLDKYTNNIVIMTTILIPIGIYLTYNVYHAEYLQISRDDTFKSVDRSWLNINENFVKYYNRCPNFINSLCFEWQRKVLGKIPISEKEDNWIAVNYISSIIFQAIEDYITISEVDETEDNVTIVNFLQWCNSDILRKNWNVIKINFDDNTIEYVDYLFKILDLHKPKNSLELSKLGSYIISSKEYKNIVYKRFNL